jgi:hypothetical protein
MLNLWFGIRRRKSRQIIEIKTLCETGERCRQKTQSYRAGAADYPTLWRITVTLRQKKRYPGMCDAACLPMALYLRALPEDAIWRA